MSTEKIAPPSEEGAPIVCKNCSHSFSGQFCPQCGQSVFEYDRPFKFLLIDFLGNIFAFDTRFWSSLKTLLLRPGVYSSEFTSGKRARYMPPFRFYIFTSFLFFLILNSFVSRSLDGQSLDITAADSTTAALLQDSIPVAIGQDISLTLDSLDLSDAGRGVQQFQEIASNPGSYARELIQFLSYSMFLLMPVYAAVLWLVYRKRKPYYFSHLVFAINQHTFTFLLLGLVMVVHMILPERETAPETYALWLLPVHTYLGTIRFYDRPFWRGIWRYLLSGMIYAFLLFFSVALVTIFWAISVFGG